MTKAKKKRKTGTAVAVHKQQLPSRPRTNLEVVIDAARDKSVEPAKLQALISMQRDFEARQSAIEFGRAMLSAKTRIPVIVRDADNKETKSRYVKLETVSKIVDPIIRDSGFTLSYGMAESNLPLHYRVTCRVRHDGAHVEEHFIDLPADNVGPKGAQNKTVVHGVASSITYARRILKCMIFDVNVADTALPDDDGNAAGGDGAITQADVERVIDACDEAGLDKAKFCIAFNIDGIPMLPAKRLREAFDRIAQYKVNNPKVAKPKQEVLV